MVNWREEGKLFLMKVKGLCNSKCFSFLSIKDEMIMYVLSAALVYFESTVLFSQGMQS